MPRMDRASTLIIIATYNERESLPPLVAEIQRFVPDADILVIDDNSPDGTGEWCDQEARTNPRLSCLHRSGKLGLGTATMAGLAHGIEHGYRYVLSLDADFSHHPRHIPAMVAGMDQSEGPPIDVMIGSRYVAGGGTEGWPLWRRLMSRGVNLYARALLGLPVRDCSGGFRCYRTAALADFDFGTIRSRGYSFLEELLWRLKRRGARLGETPIMFAERRLGKSKINVREGLAALWIIFALGVRNWLGL